MNEQLFSYYERELIFIRQMAQDFARQYPAAAGRLLLEPNRSNDPHVERLIEAFAFLSARIHLKADDEFPELTDAMLNVLYPHYLSPVPSMAMLQFDVDPGRAALPNGFLIPRGSKLRTQPVNNLPCKYRTSYDVTLWPVVVTESRMLTPPFPRSYRPPPRTAAALRLQLECVSELTFSALTLEKLCFFLWGDAQLVSELYEVAFNNVTQVVFRPLDLDATQAPIELQPDECLRQVGFERDEGVLPYPQQSFLGYRLLTEAFTFPSKFQFMEIGKLDRVCEAGFGKRMEVILYLNRTKTALEQGIDKNTFRLGCTPIINLFEHVAEPINLTHAKYEYRIVPDVGFPMGYEIFSVDTVMGADPAAQVRREYQPFYSYRHATARDAANAFWYASRRPSLTENDVGSDMFLNLVDLEFNPRLPSEEVVVVHTTCTNRSLPNLLQMAGENLRFDLEGAAPLAAIRCLRRPTIPLRPPARRGAYWRLISHLNLNHLSLTDVMEGRSVLQEILMLYDFSNPELGQMSAVNRQLIEGITSVSHRRVVGRVGGSVASGFARGVEVTIAFDEQRYVGTGVFLFASVLERFLALYASINSFSQLQVKTDQGDGLLKRWPPRAGDRQLL